MTGRQWQGQARRIRVLTGTLCLSMIALAACGGSQSDADEGGVATVASAATTPDGTAPDGTDAAADDSEAPTDPEEASELFIACMADQGFEIDAEAIDDEGPVSVEAGSEMNVAEPGEGAVVAGPGGVVIDPEDVDDYEAANEACSAHLANVQNEFDMTPEQEAAMEDAALRVENCMKDKGFDVNIDIDTGGPGLNTEENTDVGGPAEGEPIDPDDIDKDALDVATRECNKIFDEYDELDDVPVPGR